MTGCWCCCDGESSPVSWRREGDWGFGIVSATSPRRWSIDKDVVAKPSSGGKSPGGGALLSFAGAGAVAASVRSAAEVLLVSVLLCYSAAAEFCLC